MPVRKRRWVERWREEAGRNGRAAAGWEPTLEAASDGRVDLLLYRNGIRPCRVPVPEVRAACRRGRHLSARRHAQEETDEGLDLAVHQTLSNGGRVWAVTTRGDLDPVEGIGALLRY